MLAMELLEGAEVELVREFTQEIYASAAELESTSAMMALAKAESALSLGICCAFAGLGADGPGNDLFDAIVPKLMALIAETAGKELPSVAPLPAEAAGGDEVDPDNIGEL